MNATARDVVAKKKAEVYGLDTEVRGHVLGEPQVGFADRIFVNRRASGGGPGHGGSSDINSWKAWDFRSKKREERS